MAGADETASLLSRADSEFRQGLQETAAFQRTERRRRRRSAIAWGSGAIAMGAAGLLFARFAGTDGAPGRYTVAPEAPTAPVPRLESKSTEQRQSEPSPPPVPAATVTVRRAESSAPIPSAPPTEGDCQALASSGKSERAVDCYRVLGRAAGVNGDVALYHAARLSLEKLGDAARSLGLVHEHEQRFPGTALSAEVDWLKTRSLQRLGRSSEALAESEALLNGPAGRALSADLHWLRAKIFQDERGDCGSAVSELVALVGEPGARGDEAELRRARCLEKLGRSTDARAAYQHYLERPDARHPGEARERLSALPP
jgi:tetratricopeptide (TPR) repeat protein